MVTALCRDRDVLGVGVGVPGTVEQRTGTLVRAVNLPLRNIPLRDLVAAQFDLDVTLDNDGNCAALGEHRFGAATGTTHSVTLTLGTGVGGGIVADGRLFAGARGTGAELGHIVIERDGRPCQGSCPGHGHLEAYCSGTALGARGREAGLGDAHAVLAKAEQGDAAAVALLDDLGAALGAGLVTLANTLAPEAFVIAGGLGDAASHLILPTAGRILREQALPPNGEARLVPAKLGGDAGMIGAACLVLP
jgi:glucokinase